MCETTNARLLLNSICLNRLVTLALPKLAQNYAAFQPTMTSDVQSMPLAQRAKQVGGYQ